MQIKYVKTVVGWYNVYVNGNQLALNVAPELFRSLFPQVDKNTALGCLNVEEELLTQLVA